LASFVALAYGADRAVLLTDRQFAGSDTLATTYALASAIPEDR
jgi:electron transfer flavoprotein beta subunit